MKTKKIKVRNRNNTRLSMFANKLKSISASSRALANVTKGGIKIKHGIQKSSLRARGIKKKRIQQENLSIGKKMLALLQSIHLFIFLCYFIFIFLNFFTGNSTFLGCHLIALCIVFILALRKAQFISLVWKDKLFGGLFTFYLACYAISWVHYELQMSQLNQKINTLSLYATTQSHNLIGHQLSSLAEEIIPARPSIFNASQIMLSALTPTIIASDEKSTFACDNLFDILKIQKIWYDLNLDLYLPEAFEYLNVDSIIAANIDINDSNIAFFMDSDLRGIASDYFFLENIIAIESVDFSYSSISSFAIHSYDEETAAVRAKFPYADLKDTGWGDPTNNLPRALYTDRHKWYVPRISDVHFTCSMIDNSIFSDAFFSDVKMDNALFTYTNFNNTHFYGVDFSNSYFSDCDFAGAALFLAGNKTSLFHPLLKKLDAHDIPKKTHPLAFTPVGGEEFISDSQNMVDVMKMINGVYTGKVTFRSSYEFNLPSEPLLKLGEPYLIHANSFKDAVFIDCKMDVLWIAGMDGRKAVKVDSNTRNKAVVVFCANILMEASSFYGTKLPKHVEEYMRKHKPELFEEKDEHWDYIYSNVHKEKYFLKFREQAKLGYTSLPRTLVRALQ